jgi:hypothetical protein
MTPAAARAALPASRPNPTQPSAAPHGAPAMRALHTEAGESPFLRPDPSLFDPRVRCTHPFPNPIVQLHALCPFLAQVVDRHAPPVGCDPLIFHGAPLFAAGQRRARVACVRRQGGRQESTGRSAAARRRVRTSTQRRHVGSQEGRPTRQQHLQSGPWMVSSPVRAAPSLSGAPLLLLRPMRAAQAPTRAWSGARRKESAGDSLLQVGSTWRWQAAAGCARWAQKRRICRVVSNVMSK